MLKKLLGVFFIATITVLLGRVDAYAVTFDNDGSARENPYGDAGFPSSFGEDVAYYDCYIPYGLTCGEVGGEATSVSGATSSSYNAVMSEDVKGWPAGTRCNYEGNMSNAKFGTKSIDSETGCVVYTNSNGDQYYVTAIQHFFYNNSTVGTNGFYGWSSANRGQMFDCVLTDGTVIHFVVGDANAIQHTNAGSDDTEGSFDVKWGFGEIHYPQYKHLFSALGGNCLELWGSSSACVNKFMQKYGLGKAEGKNRIAYYRMYNKKIQDNIQRADGVGDGVSYSLGDVTIDASGSNTENTDEEHTDSLGNVITPESGLVGMDGLTESALSQQELLELAKRENLSVGEQYSVVAIGEDVALAKKALTIDNARIAIVFVGLCFVFYGVLLGMCMLVDKVNTFIEISCTGIITFGFLRYTDDEDLKSTKGYASLGKMLATIAVVFAIGCLIISGGVMPFLMGIVEKVKDIF